MEGMESFKPHAENERASEEEKERQSLEFHNFGLHDQEEDASGAKVDEATGKPINKTTAETGTSSIHTKFELRKDDPSEDVMGSIKEEEDAAAKWLREHDKGDDIKKAA